MAKFFLNKDDSPEKMSEVLDAAKSKMPRDIAEAHKHNSKHRAEILASDLCGCFYCEKIFGPEEIVGWIDDDQTALCPKCDIDSVIGSASGFPINKEFLHQMCEYWF